MSSPFHWPTKPSPRDGPHGGAPEAQPASLTPPSPQPREATPRFRLGALRAALRAHDLGLYCSAWGLNDGFLPKGSWWSSSPRQGNFARLAQKRPSLVFLFTFLPAGSARSVCIKNAAPILVLVDSFTFFLVFKPATGNGWLCCCGAGDSGGNLMEGGTV